MFKRTIATSAFLVMSGCSTVPTAALAPSASVDHVVVQFVLAPDDLMPKARPYGTVRLALTDADAAHPVAMPWLSVARLCGPDHKQCSEAVVKNTLLVSMSRQGTTWLLTGELRSEFGATGTIRAIGATPTIRSIDSDAKLIQPPVAPDGHFSWLVRPDSQIVVHGPLGIQFTLGTDDEQ